MKTARDMQRENLATAISLYGVTATAVEGGAIVSGIFSPDQSDPRAYLAEGNSNTGSPNRYHFVAIDDAGVLKETFAYTILGEKYVIFDLDPLLVAGGKVGVRAALLKD